MNQINKEQFICLDCETTGLDTQQDRIIEVAVARFTLEGILESFESLIDPEATISESSIEIHNITPDMVAGKPVIAAVIPELLHMIGNHTIVGHGIRFDIEIIAASAARAGIPCTLMHNSYIDTLRMARFYGQSPVNSLEQLRKHFNIDFEGAHRAMNDVLVNIDVFKKLAFGFKSKHHIFETLSSPIEMKVMPLGPHKGRLFRDVPLPYLLWAANKDFDMDLLFSIRSELKRRKKGNLFAQSNNPFAEL